jgi:hypothetical protein
MSKVSNKYLAQMPANTVKGNNTGSPSNPIDLTVVQVNAILPVVTSSLNGLAPASGGGTSNYLRADGTWTAPPGSGGGITQLTGDITAGAGSGSQASSVAKIQGNTVVGTTGTTNVVFSNNPVFTGTITASSANFSGELSSLNLSGINTGTSTQTTLTGSAGTAICSQPFQGTSYMKVVIYLNGYTDTGTQVYTFPVAFSHTPFIYGLLTAVSGATVSSTTITFTVTTNTGFVFLEGY